VRKENLEANLTEANMRNVAAGRGAVRDPQFVLQEEMSAFAIMFGESDFFSKIEPFCLAQAPRNE